MFLLLRYSHYKVVSLQLSLWIVTTVVDAWEGVDDVDIQGVSKERMTFVVMMDGDVIASRRRRDVASAPMQELVCGLVRSYYILQFIIFSLNFSVSNTFYFTFVQLYAEMPERANSHMNCQVTSVYNFG